MHPTIVNLLGMLPSPVLEQIDIIRKMNIRQIILQFLNLCTMFMSAYMLYKVISVTFNNPSPATVVLSQSMYPAFSRGDILVLTMNDAPIDTGDITVFNLKGQKIPIVHRVVKVHESLNGDLKVLTKGDNNDVHDRGLYNRGQLWLEKQDFVGRVKLYISYMINWWKTNFVSCVPYLGIFTIYLNEYPKLKALLIASMGYFMITTRE